MNRILRLLLKIPSYLKIDIKKDYQLVRRLQQVVFPDKKIPYRVMDCHINSPDDARDIPARIFLPKGDRKPGALIFFHGGGWVIGDIGTYTITCLNMAEMTGRAVYSVDYRLAPEHPFPAGLEDCYLAAAAMFDHPDWLDVDDTSEITLIGDSAGGNLAAVVSQMFRDRGREVPARQVLLYPSTHWDRSEDSPFASIRAYGREYGLTAENIEDYMTLYEPNLEKRKDPYISPLMASDLSGQPETLVITAEFDPLRDEGEAYGEALRQAGNRVRVHRIPDAAHGFIAYPKFARPVVEAYEVINAFLND
ncbi:MAG: alpha/beta hydrolase [Syntrophomonadaceae bacterium]|nr:alpha/beta hydrolase [Syntrophomonadaceae bacterium]